MRFIVVAATFAISACGQAEPPPPPLPAPVAGAATWFICDAIDAPALFHVERDGREIRVNEYAKPNGAIVSRSSFLLGADDPAAGSVTTALLGNGVEAGAVRRTNPGMLETPGAAYTTRVTELRLGERTVACRWLPRTRVFGFTGRRSFVIHEDADGDLIYTTYDFTSASAQQRIELSENALTTPFSVEVRGGEERVRPDGVTYAFSGGEGFAYVVTTTRDGQGALEVRRDDEVVQNEPLTAFQTGDAAGE